jgi:hypothetical protein
MSKILVAAAALLTTLALTAPPVSAQARPRGGARVSGTARARGGPHTAGAAPVRVPPRPGGVVGHAVPRPPGSYPPYRGGGYYGRSYYPYRGHGGSFGFYYGYPYYGFGSYYGYPYSRYGLYVGVGFGYGYPYAYGYPYGYGYPYPYYGYPSSYGGYYDTYPGGYVAVVPGGDYGGLRIETPERDAQVWVDGYYRGVVDDFDGMFQKVKLPPGPHHVEVTKPGFATVAFEVDIQPGRTITYRADMQRR